MPNYVSGSYRNKYRVTSMENAISMDSRALSETVVYVS
jgi:hypothetical protein